MFSKEAQKVWNAINQYFCKSLIKEIRRAVSLVKNQQANNNLKDECFLQFTFRKNEVFHKGSYAQLFQKLQSNWPNEKKVPLQLAVDLKLNKNILKLNFFS